MYRLLLALSISLFIVHAIQAQENFPDDFLGVYKGNLEIDSQRGKQSFAMEFHLLKTDTVGRYKYTIVYGEGETRQERKYFMIEKDAKNGEYLVDEDNGIILLEKLYGNRLYSLFEVSGNLLTTFITFESNQVIWEITFSPKSEQEVSYATADSTQVIAYPITTRQRAILKKQ